MEEAVVGYTAGYSLPQHLYLDDVQYRRDVKWLGDHLWFPVDHESRIPNVGDYFLCEYDKESVIVVRDRNGVVRAHYNVCQHRGSRICLEPSGSKQSFLCPYHAWNYALNGRLRAAPFMPADFDKAENGLTPCHVKVHCGLIFISYAEVPPEFAAFVKGFTREMEFNDLAHAKVIKRAQFVTSANWKLVVQNNLECYHCGPAHPCYSGAHPGTLAPHKDADEYGGYLWEPPDTELERSRQFEPIKRNPESLYAQSSSRRMLGGNFKSESIGGAPVAPLMGRATYDGAQTLCTFSPLTTFVVNPDYAVVYNFIPRNATRTDIQAIWMVTSTAIEGTDYDISRVTAVWDATLSEDKALVQNNQSGVESGRYRPGRYSRLELGVSDFDRWYIDHVATRTSQSAAAP